MLEQLVNGEYQAAVTKALLGASVILISWFLVFAACLVDMWSGISAAKALKEPLNSHGFRKTMTKVGDYFKVSLIGFLFDLIGFLFSFYTLPFASLLVTLGVLIIEGKSVMENVERKKSKAGELRRTLKDIIDAASEKDAKKILKKILKEESIEQKNGKWKSKQLDKQDRLR